MTLVKIEWIDGDTEVIEARYTKVRGNFFEVVTQTRPNSLTIWIPAERVKRIYTDSVGDSASEDDYNSRGNQKSYKEKFPTRSREDEW